MKKILYITPLLVLLTVVFAVHPVWAQLGAQNTLRVAQRAENQATRTAQAQATALSALQARANEMIQTRLTTLDNLLAKVQADTKLTATEKASLTTDINTTITSLQNLKAKIDADTDLTTARTDAKTIVTSYRIYEVYEPKVRLLIVINNLQTLSTKLTVLMPQVQNLITTLSSQGKNVTDIQTLYTDINNQLTTINSTLSTDQTLVEGVTATTTTPNTVFVQVRQSLAQVVRTDFAKIREDFGQMRGDFMQVFKTNPTVTPKVTTTPEPSTASSSAK